MHVSLIFGWRISPLRLTVWMIYHGMWQKIHTRPCWMINQDTIISHSCKTATPFLEFSVEAGTSPTTRYLSGGKYCLTFIIQQVSWPSISFDQLKFFVFFTSMADTRDNLKFPEIKENIACWGRTMNAAKLLPAPRSSSWLFILYCWGIFGPAEIYFNPQQNCTFRWVYGRFPSERFVIWSQKKS